MEFLVILIIEIILLILGLLVFEFSIKKMKKFEKDEELDNIAKRYPENIDMCKKYLKILKNDRVKVENDEKIKSSLYIAISDKIVIANIKDSYTRIQTIAHECLHSIQDRRLLMGNFWFSNFYILFFIIICILGIFNMIPNKMLFIAIFTMLSMMYCLIRSFLENDAMIKARFLAEEYMKNEKISSDEEIDKMIKKFDELNNIGVKYTNYYVFFIVMIKIVIFSTICILI